MPAAAAHPHSAPSLSGPDPRASRQRFAPRFRVVVDPDASTDPGRCVLIGGRPLRAMALHGGADEIDELLSGQPVEIGAHNASMMAELLDLGLVHPAPNAGLVGRESVTVVVPVRDDGDGLARLLCADSSLEGVAEIIVVDDGSRQPDTIDRSAAQAGATVVRRQSPQGPAAARNLGVSLASTELIAFVDADCLPTPGWLDGLLGHFGDRDVAAVAPRIRAVAAPGHDAPGGVDGPLLAFELEHGPLDCGPHPSLVGPDHRVGLVPSAALLVRRHAWEDVGGFDEDLRFGEDTDFEWRLVEKGWLVRYDPAAVVEHPIRSSGAEMLTQRFRYGLPAGWLSRRHPRFRMLDAEPANLLALVAAALGLPALAAGAEAALAVAGASRIHDTGVPWGPALRRRLSEVVADAHGVALSLGETYLPFTVAFGVASRRLRPLAAAALLGPPLLDWARRRPPAPPAAWVGLHLATRAASCAGVWTGMVQARSGRPLVPGRKKPTAGPSLTPRPR